MLEYLFNSDYRAAKNKYDAAKAKRNKLQKIVNDITNDTSSINTINHRLDYVNEDFAKSIRMGSVRGRVTNKLVALREPYQNSDSYLIQACDYIDAEENYLVQQMNNADASMDSIKNGSGGGGR